MRLTSIFLFVIFSLTRVWAGSAAAEIPIADLFGLPSISQMRFSPDGRYLAALQPWERRLNLIVVDLQKMEKTQVTSMQENDLTSYFWAGNGRIFFLMDADGKEQPNLFAVDADGRNAEPLNTLRGLAPVSPIHGDLEHYVVSAADLKPSLSDIYHLNLRTGKTRLHARNPGNFNNGWTIDRAGVARLGRSLENGVVTIYYRDNAKAEWEVLATFKDGEPHWEPLGFEGDNRIIYVSSNLGRKTAGVFRFDTQTRSMGELVHGDETYDVANVVYNDALNRVVAVTYDAERPVTVWLDESLAKLQQSLDAALPRTINTIARASADNSKFLVRAASDQDPGTYYLYDRKHNAMEKLAALKPNLQPAQLASMQPFSYPARDGLRIHGYITLPVGADPRNLPMIVNPHGGPFGPRDTWGFNPEVQFYANRGFAVLQMNFRGSGGYGDWFERAGYGKWGLEIQDDITDGVKWAIAQGIADPARIVISGASYGGYAAMAGLVYTPELYCAGINYVGVTDIMMLVDLPGLGKHDARNAEWWRRTRIGDPYKDRERIKATSPANFADRIRVPLLMAYGENDPRVEIAHGSNVVRGLKHAGRVEGRDFWFITEKYEGHGFAKEEKRIAFYQEIDRFLHKVVPALNGSVRLGPMEILPMPVKAGTAN